MGMSFSEDVVVAFIAGLKRPAERDYAKAYWRYLKTQMAQPSPDRYGVTAAEAQAIRIRLAGAK
jgi:hypothetical protein